MFGRATIMLGIGPHSSFLFILSILCVLLILLRLIRATISVFFVTCCPVLLSFYLSYLIHFQTSGAYWIALTDFVESFFRLLFTLVGFCFLNGRPM